MRDLLLIPGIRELGNINQYALEALTQEERQFIEKMNKIAEDYKNEQGDIFGSNEQREIQTLWQKYKHAKPFRFRFDPEKKIPEVFRNKRAFIIWTTWKAGHIVCNEDLVDEGSIAAAKILSRQEAPFPEDIKKLAVREFRRYLHAFLAEQKGGVDEDKEKKELAFWEQHIFPFLEGKWGFKWEMIKKCFYCSNDAIAICDSCSPTSSTGLTPEKPLCEDCIVNGIGINIVRFLIPEHEAESKIQYAARKMRSKEIGVEQK